MAFGENSDGYAGSAVRRMYLEHDVRSKPSYEFYKDGMNIRDPVWGNCFIGREEGDEVLLALGETALVKRTMSIEQLTLDRYVETIPGTADFSRWEHIWGSVVFVRKMCEGLEMSSRDKIILQLRAFVSDLGHTAYSHLGDWIFQGAGGKEDRHDEELSHLLQVSGISDILQKYGIRPEEVVFPDIEDWVECPSPDLCVDRVDYGAREIQRWLNLSSSVYYSLKPEAFSVDEGGKLVMRSYKDALAFSKAFLLLPTEHWHEPVHRLVLRFQEQLVKHVLTSEDAALFASDMDPPTDYHPRDYMYTYDNDITTEHVATRDIFASGLRWQMEDIARYRRRSFAHNRKGQLSAFFSDHGKDTKLPDPLQNYGWGSYHGLPLLPPSLTVTPVDGDAKAKNRGKNSFEVLLPALKPRFIDPLFYDESGKICRLSEVDDVYKSLLAQQKRQMEQAYIAKLSANEETIKILRDGEKRINQRWPEALARPRMSPDEFRRMLARTAMLSHNHRLVEVEVVDTGAFTAYAGEF